MGPPGKCSEPVDAFAVNGFDMLLFHQIDAPLKPLGQGQGTGGLGEGAVVHYDGGEFMPRLDLDPELLEQPLYR